MTYFNHLIDKYLFCEHLVHKILTYTLKLSCLMKIIIICLSSSNHPVRLLQINIAGKIYLFISVGTNTVAYLLSRKTWLSGRKETACSVLEGGFLSELCIIFISGLHLPHLRYAEISLLYIVLCFFVVYLPSALHFLH